MIIEKLKEFDLSENEAEVYKAVVELGDTPVSKIIDKTDMHPNIVYTILEKLTLRGLISESKRDHKKHFKVNDPHSFVVGAKSKLKLARNIENEITKLSKNAQQTQKVSIFQGEKAVVMGRKFVLDSIEDGGMYWVLNANFSAFSKAMGGEFERQEREISKRGIKQIFISYEKQRSDLKNAKARFYKKIKRDFHFLTGEENIGMSIDFSKERVAILLFGIESLVIGVSDHIMARGYRQLFESLLKSSLKD